MLLGFVSYDSCKFCYRENASALLDDDFLKDIVNQYTTENSSVNACFVDLNKALERVSHR